MLAVSTATLRDEAYEHFRGLTDYVSALSWTHALLPTLGGPTVVNVATLMHRRQSIPYLCFLWVYVCTMTSLCWWGYSFGMKRARERTGSSLVDRVHVAGWSQFAGSLAWIATWAWMCALLASLLTQTVPECALTAGIITVVSAGSVLAGQRGRGPFANALSSHPQELRLVLFFASWMVAVAWVGAFDELVDTTGASPVGGGWFVAAAVLALRWAWLWQAATGGIVAAGSASISTPLPPNTSASMRILTVDTHELGARWPRSFGLRGYEPRALSSIRVSK